MTTGKPERTIEYWETVAVTALPPGWRNVYAQDDGSEEYTPCPAILLQEHRYDEIWSGEEQAGLRVRRKNIVPPYETRAVYADDQGSGWLDRAEDAIRTEWSQP